MRHLSLLSLSAPIILLAACDLDKATPIDTAPVEIVDTDTAPPVDNDQDDDTILDVHEGDEDVDGDGLANFLDDDSDGDGIPDAVEAGDDDWMTMPIDTDEDGIDDYLDTDSDGNGIGDGDEAGNIRSNPTDSDDDGTADYRDYDNDGDGILDVWEMDAAYLPEGEEPEEIDTDGDGTPDYMDLDSDDDSLCDIWEGGTSSYQPEPIDTDYDGTPDYRDLDSDDDGMSDEDEAGTTQCGQPDDVDGDGKPNSADTDSDGDGLTDVEEIEEYNTDPYDADTDNDQQSDGAEVAAESDPNNALETIEGVYIELDERTTQETTFSFEPAIQFIDMIFLLDTTGSMASTLSSAATRFREIVEELEDSFENVAFGLASFDDYNYGGMGSGSDKPFILKQTVTDDGDAMQDALNRLNAGGGSDTPESAMEALYQAISGKGYDQACDGDFDTTDDVMPFLSETTDAFNGTSESYVSDTELSDPGGVGFNDLSLRVLVYATDYYMRDADSSNTTLAATPGGCPQDAGSGLVASSLASMGSSYLIGVDVGSGGPGNSTAPYDGMEQLAYDSNSLADIDGDGNDDPLVFWMPQGSSSFSEEFKEGVVNAVEQLAAGLEFEKVEVSIAGDEWGIIESVDPDSYENVDPDEVDTLDFTITFTGTIPALEDDQIYAMVLNVIADDEVLLASKDIIVVVPGTSY